jgi:hypothetical protein
VKAFPSAVEQNAILYIRATHYPAIGYGSKHPQKQHRNRLLNPTVMAIHVRFEFDKPILHISPHSCVLQYTIETVLSSAIASAGNSDYTYLTRAGVVLAPHDGE